LELRCDVDNPRYKSPLHLAINGKDPSYEYWYIPILLKEGARVNVWPLPEPSPATSTIPSPCLPSISPTPPIVITRTAPPSLPLPSPPQPATMTTTTDTTSSYSSFTRYNDTLRLSDRVANENKARSLTISPNPSSSPPSPSLPLPPPECLYSALSEWLNSGRWSSSLLVTLLNHGADPLAKCYSRNDKQEWTRRLSGHYQNSRCYPDLLNAIANAPNEMFQRSAYQRPRVGHSFTLLITTTLNKKNQH
jgi:hypothetical protein